MRNFLNIRIDLTAINQMDEHWFMGVWVSFILFSLYFLLRFYKSVLKYKTLSDIPTSKIRSAAQGYIELQGKQEAAPSGAPLLTPLGQLPCTWYAYTIEHFGYNNSNAKNKQWIQIESVKSSELFILEDGTGECIIDPTGAQIATPLCLSWRGFARRPNGIPKGWFWRLWSLIGPYRYTEWRMEPGMPLYAVGNYCTQNQNQSQNHILSNQGLDTRQPFILSAYKDKVVITDAKREALIWALAFILLFGFTLWIGGIRFGW